MTGPFSSSYWLRRRPRTFTAARRPSARLHVLHVVEALGSGIATALEDYLRSTPDHIHSVIAYRRPSAQTGDELSSK